MSDVLRVDDLGDRLVLLGAAHAWVDRTLRAAPLALRPTKMTLRATRVARGVLVFRVRPWQ